MVLFYFTLVMNSELHEMNLVSGKRKLSPFSSSSRGLALTGPPSVFPLRLGLAGLLTSCCLPTGPATHPRRSVLLGRAYHTYNITLNHNRARGRGKATSQRADIPLLFVDFPGLSANEGTSSGCWVEATRFLSPLL